MRKGVSDKSCQQKKVRNAENLSKKNVFLWPVPENGSKTRPIVEKKKVEFLGGPQAFKPVSPGKVKLVILGKKGGGTGDMRSRTFEGSRKTQPGRGGCQGTRW